MFWGALIGAVISAGIEIVAQRMNGQPIDWKKVGQAAVVGAVTGLVGGAIAGRILARGAQAVTNTTVRASVPTRLAAYTAGGAGGNAAGRVTDNALEGRDLTDGVIEHAAVGAAFGAGSVPVEAGVRRAGQAVLARVRPPVVAPRTPVKLHMGAQRKHINPADGRSSLDHPDPQRLLDRVAGTGEVVSPNLPPRGTNGFRERVDFGEVIGTYVDSAGNRFPTTMGIIHYGKHGAHIVPARPRVDQLPLSLRNPVPGLTGRDDESYDVASLDDDVPGDQEPALVGAATGDEGPRAQSGGFLQQLDRR